MISRPSWFERKNGGHFMTRRSWLARIPNRCSLALVASLCSACGGAHTQPAAPATASSRATAPAASEAPAKRETTIPVRDLDASDRQFDDLAPLARVLGDARVVLLGEPSHLDGAAFDAKVRLIEFLHEQLGFDLLAWEAGMWSCEQMDARVRQPASEGDPRELGLGWPWAGVQQTKAIFEYARAAAHTGKPLRMTGIDVNFTGKDAVPRYRDWLVSYADAAHAWSFEQRAKILEAFDRFPKQKKFSPLTPETRAHDRAAFAALRAALAGSGGDRDRALAIRTLEAVDALYRWHEAVGADQSATIPWDEHVALNNVRDEAMAENILWLLEQNPRSRIVVWMANVHAARSLETLDVSGSSVNPHAFHGYHPTGEHLARALGSRAYSIAITAFDGSVGNPPTKPYSLSPTPEGSFESQMASGPAPIAFVDFRGAPAEVQPVARFIGYGRYRAVWSRVFDGALFIHTMYPATVQ
jgi:erythromycin esterase